MSNKISTHNFMKYIPSLVTRRVLQLGDKPWSLPEVQPLETVAMFSDISGFTSISESCAKLGARGAEELVFCVNRYMEGLVKCITKYGGDIIKFVGDAMIVLWPREEGERLETIARKATQCALEIQAELNDKKITQGFSRLSVKIGIGAGSCGLLYVGGVFHRAEFLAIGDALVQALQSEHCCSHGGQVIVSGKCWELIQNNFHGIPIGTNGNYEIQETKGPGVKVTADNLFLRNRFEYFILANKLYE